MKILIVLLLISVVLGILLAFRLTSLRGTKLLADLSESMAEAQRANREILRQRFGHESAHSSNGGDGVFEVIASPMFGFACVVVAAMQFAHPESALYLGSWSDLSAKGVFLMVGQVALLALSVCSITLMIFQWRKK